MSVEEEEELYLEIMNGDEEEEMSATEAENILKAIKALKLKPIKPTPQRTLSTGWKQSWHPAGQIRRRLPVVTSNRVHQPLHHSIMASQEFPIFLEHQRARLDMNCGSTRYSAHKPTPFTRKNRYCRPSGDLSREKQPML